MTQLARFGSLRNKRVFITGGGTGIGEAMVISFAEQGAQVAFVDIARDASLALVRRVRDAGYPEPKFHQCDITDIPALQAAMADLAGAITRFLRPVSYQNLAQPLLPEVLRDNGSVAWRRLEGELTHK